MKLCCLQNHVLVYKTLHEDILHRTLWYTKNTLYCTKHDVLYKVFFVYHIVQKSCCTVHRFCTHDSVQYKVFFVHLYCTKNTLLYNNIVQYSALYKKHFKLYNIVQFPPLYCTTILYCKPHYTKITL